MDREKLSTDIIERIAKHAEPDAGTVTTETELTALGIHSLELTEIIFDIEDEYGIEVQMNSADAWSNLRTVGDIVEAVGQLIDAKG
jgi:nodulation protein F